MKRKGEIRIGPISQKVLLILLTGVALGLNTSPNRHFRILKTAVRAWKDINRRAMYAAIRRLYKAKLIGAKDNQDGSTTIILTQKGRIKALTYNLDEMKIPKMKKWDGNWRIVLFDIPEKYKKSRDALSRILKNMGFYKFQKSVFVHPFECGNEIDFIVEFFALRSYVRIIIAHEIDNTLHLKQYIKL